MRRSGDQRGLRVAANHPGYGLVLSLLLLVAPRLTASPIDQYFYQGVLAQARGDFDRAIPAWDEVLRLNPNDLAAFQNRGLSYLYQNDWSRSIKDYSEVIQRKSNDIAAFDGRGYAHFQQRDWAAAIDDFNAAIRLNPRNWALYRNLGRVYLTMGNWDAAITNFTKTIRLNPRDDWAYNCRAVAYEDKGEIAAAIADFRQAVQISPNYANVYVNCGNLFRDYKDALGVAILDYTEAIRLDPTNSEIYLTRADTYRTLKKFDCAARDYNQAVQLSPASAEGYHARGWFQYEMTNYPAAAEDFDSAVHLNPSNAWYWADLGCFHSQMTNYSAATADFSQCISLQPANAGYYADRAQAEESWAKVSAMTGDQSEQKEAQDRATTDWDEAAARQSSYLIALGQFEARKGQYENAILDFTEYIQTSPNDIAGWFARAGAYEQMALEAVRRGELEKGKDELKLALADWDRLAAMDNRWIAWRGNFHARNHDFAGALADYQAAIKAQPASAENLIFLAWFRATCPDRSYRNGAEAVTAARKACELEPPSLELYQSGLAAAYAETGDFAEAVHFQEAALQTPGCSNEARIEMQHWLTLYQKGRPCRRPPRFF